MTTNPPDPAVTLVRVDDRKLIDRLRQRDMQHSQSRALRFEAAARIEELAATIARLRGLDPDATEDAQ